MTEQERRALFFKTTGRLASIDKQSYYAFCCGVASRDADIQRLQMAIADAEALEIGTAEKCNQLRAELAKLQAENVAYASNLRGKHSIAGATYETLRQQLAAEQAKNAVLPDALRRLWDESNLEPIPYVQEALSTKSDTSTLEAMIAKAGEKMRERCAVVADDDAKRSFLGRVVREIRAIPGVTLEDLK